MDTTTRNTEHLTRMATVLNTLPTYAEATIWCKRGGDTGAYLLMCRDWPTYDPMQARRCTCLTTGSEWFITTALLDTMDAVSLGVTKTPTDWTVQ
jgi:hypothetical protein